MTLTAILALAGCIALLVGIFGGGVKAKEVEVPLIPIGSRITSSLVGLGLIVTAIWINFYTPPLPNSQSATTQTSSSSTPSAAGMQTSTMANTGVVGAPTVIQGSTGIAPDCTQTNIWCIGNVTDIGRVDDKSFNQSVWEGVQNARTDGYADWIQYIETSDSSDYAKNVSTFAEAGYKIIVTNGFNLADVTYVAAKKYPHTMFIGVDQFLSRDTNHPDWPLPNLVGIVYNEDQSGFMVGALGERMSKTHKIGAVCATDGVPTVWRYGEGYRNGAAYEDKKTNSTTEVMVEYHSDVGFDKTFIDPTWGADTANAIIDKGADVIFGCGGITGNGAVNAAAQRKVYVIGVDVDQYYTLPDAAPWMLSSALKPETSPVTAMIKLIYTGKFPTGGLYFGASGYAPYHDLASKVPVDVDTEMQALFKGLMEGSIKTNVSPIKP